MLNQDSMVIATDSIHAHINIRLQKILVINIPYKLLN